VELRATATDEDLDELSFRWTSTLGGLVNPYTPNTSYRCSAVGNATLTLTVTDGICERSIQANVACTP
jgi:hypothetical protein